MSATSICPTYLPLLIKPAVPPCTETVVNGGFGETGGWTFPITANTAGYTTVQAFSGVRSARFGLPPGMAAAQSTAPARVEYNLLGEAGIFGATYSSGYQTVSIPAGLASATLHFCYWPGSQDTTGIDFQRALVLQPGEYHVLPS